MLRSAVCAIAPRCTASGRTAVAASPPQNERRVRDDSFVVIVSLPAFPFGIIEMPARRGRDLIRYFAPLVLPAPPVSGHAPRLVDRQRHEHEQHHQTAS